MRHGYIYAMDAGKFNEADHPRKGGKFTSGGGGSGGKETGGGEESLLREWKELEKKEKEALTKFNKTRAQVDFDAFKKLNDQVREIRKRVPLSEIHKAAGL